MNQTYTMHHACMLSITIMCAGAEKCYREGTIVTYQCEVPALPGTLDWNGIGFDCPSKTGTTVTNNTIALSVEPLTVCSASSKVKIGTCGPYFANLTCAEDGMHVTSVLEFQANYEMNEGNIYCFFHGRNETFVVQVGGKLIIIAEYTIVY